MKKILTLLLALALTCSPALPASAAGAGADERLEAVTESVKKTLALDTGGYQNFYGNLDENQLSPLWYLSWDGDAGNLSVTAGEDGRVVNYYRYDNEDYGYSALDSLAFPSGDRVAAERSARAFLGRVLLPGETVEFQEDDGGRYLSETSFYFPGTVYLNGLPSPLTVSINVRASDNVVTSFYREDRASSYVGNLPGAKPLADAAKAAPLLKDTLSMRLEYSLTGDGKTAALCYLPNGRDDYYVDALTGELVNLTEKRLALYGGNHYYEMGYASAQTSAADANYRLTEVEQSGVEKLAGVLSKDALDQALRAMPELGLGDYVLAHSRFYVTTTGSEAAGDLTETVTAELTYGRQAADGNVWQKYVTADARTGELITLWTSSPWDESPKQAVDRAAAREKASAFLGKYFEDSSAYAEYDYGALNGVGLPSGDEYTTEWYFTYARRENGYFFTGDQYSLGISVYDGTLTSFSRQEVPGVTFEDADGLVSPSAALDAWFGSFDVELGYLAVPAELDLSKPEYQPLIAMGLSSFNSLELGWRLTSEDFVMGVNAKTGELIRPEPYEDGGAILYQDLEGCWAKSQIEALARYQVGYDGGSFGPDTALTQRDLVALVMSLWGYRHDPADLEGEKADSLYGSAYGMGVLTRSERDDTRVLTRGEAVKLLLDATGYAPVARLQVIYRSSYADASGIPAELTGYAALAQGLGIVKGDGGTFAAGRSATRAEAAVMIYNYLSR